MWNPYKYELLSCCDVHTQFGSYIYIFVLISMCAKSAQVLWTYFMCYYDMNVFGINRMKCLWVSWLDVLTQIVWHIVSHNDLAKAHSVHFKVGGTIMGHNPS